LFWFDRLLFCFGLAFIAKNSVLVSVTGVV